MGFSSFIGKEDIVLKSELEEGLTELKSTELQFMYLRSENFTSCSLITLGLRNTVRDYNKNLEKVQSYSGGILKSEEYELLKRRYILSSLRYWIFAEDLRKNCDFNSTTLLFFTKSLNNGERDVCEKRVAENLNKLKDKYGENLLVFTISTRLEVGLVDILKRQYNVTEVPTLVINGKKVLSGCLSQQRIEESI